jgi:cell division protein FtsB
MEIRALLQSRLITVVLAGMLLLVMGVTAKLLVQKRAVDNEIALLQARATDIHKSNQELSELIKYLNTTEYTEREAREKLNLKKDGEIVVGLPSDKETDGQVAGTVTQNSPNPQKWFNYFFGERN